MAAHCVLCDQSFGSDKALQQHKRDSPAHVPFCDDCDRSSDSREALEQHIRDSPTSSFDCEICDRSFGNKEALKQHLRDSPVHAPSFDCPKYNRFFNSEEALEQHLRGSPAHSPSFDCETCNRTFNSREALEQHLRNSPVHQQNTETPLDAFFLSFPTFTYDPSLPPAVSYASLQKQEGWRRGDTVSNDAWDRYQDALESELNMWFGTEDNLTAWHALCRAIGIEPLPKTCRKCEKVRAPVLTIGRLIHTGAGYRLQEGYTLI